jgi:thioredoxin-related protein
MSLHRQVPMASVKSFATALASMMMLIGSLHPTLSRASEELGAFLGAMDTEHPGWFKESFLDFEEDIDEAAAEGRRLVLYFWQTGCPYCNALIEHNFAQRDITSAMQAHFDLVAVNMWGDREVVQVGGRTFTEKTLAAALQVHYTPTLLFFDEARQVILRLNGYYPPDAFRAALAWAQSDTDNSGDFSAYLASLHTQDANPQLNPQPFFEPASGDLSPNEDQALAVYFEQPNCRQCDTLHEKVLTHDIVQAQASKMRSVQMDMWSDQLITTPDGRQTTARVFARDLNIQFAPTVVFFDASGKEVMRLDGAFRTFHTQGIMRYVNDRAYLTRPSFQRYLGELAEHWREKGWDVDIWSYDLPVSHNGKAVMVH